MVATYAEVVAFLPLQPAVLGHTLVAPKRHVAGIEDLDRATGHALSDAVLDVAARVRAVLGPAGLNVVQSSGTAATQSVFHLHVHVVPRNPGDRLPVLWPPPRDWPEEDLDLIVRKFRALPAG
jgi:histidine triad (HIT) family protein